jgi:hypothetical protein
MKETGSYVPLDYMLIGQYQNIFDHPSSIVFKGVECSLKVTVTGHPCFSYAFFAILHILFFMFINW